MGDPIPKYLCATTPIKTGTLTGVYNLAGYIKTEVGERPFVKMMEQAKNNRWKVLDILLKIKSPNDIKGRTKSQKAPQ